MRKKLACLLLAGALALSLSACAPGGEIPGPAETPSQPVETAPVSQEPSEPPSETPSLSPEPPAPPLSADYDLPDRDYQPWQTAYIDFLSALRQADKDTWGKLTESGEYYWPAYEGLAVDERGVYCLDAGEPLRMTLVMAMGSEYYSLYDVDRDGVPELFVKYGNCEAAFTTQCYTYRDGQIVCIGEFRSGHSNLYTHPDKSAVLRSNGHMGYKKVYEYLMEDGRLTEEWEIFSEEDVWEYTEMEEIVPGAEDIPWFYTALCFRDSFAENQDKPSAGKALLLPICDWYDGPAATGDDSAQGRSAILAALNGDTELYGASGDHFHGDVGPTTWEEYVQPGAAYPYNDEPLEVSAHAWLDMNGDGQEELLLRVVTDIGEDNGKPWASESTIVLSKQDGTVYAYYFGFYDDREAFHDDGTIREYGEDRRLSFWKGQCYQYAVPATSAPAVKWLDGSPVG